MPHGSWIGGGGGPGAVTSIADTQIKTSAKACADTNQTLTGLPVTIDGIGGWLTSDVVLLVGQTDPIENGIWLVSTNAWSRAPGMIEGLSVAGTQCWVHQGVSNGDNSWRVTNDPGSDVIGTDGLVYAPESGAVFTVFQEEITADTAILTRKTGFHRIRSNRNSTTQTISLPDPTEYDTEKKREAGIDMEVWGTVAPTINVVGGSNIKWQGDEGPFYTVPDQMFTVSFRTDGTNWAIFMRAA